MAICMALWNAVQLARPLQNSINILSDCIILVDTIVESVGKWPWSYASLITGIVDALSVSP
ncbi:hypothetical protein LINGRAHAP2_LOCUS3131, partial [Linum grandiflorum]